MPPRLIRPDMSLPMACLHIGRPSCSPAIIVVQHGSRNRRFSSTNRLSLRCSSSENDDRSTGEEPTESLFLKELKRRGMSSSAPPRMEGSGYSKLAETEMEIEGERSDGRSRGGSKRGLASADYEKALENQRERSMALNSEGIEGLLPRAKLLLSLGGTFFLSFGPLILVTVASFSVLYLYFGPAFVHGASRSSSPPPYVDPYQLLEEQRMSQMAPPLE